MKRRLTATVLTAAFAVSAFGASAIAGQPENPGCFGQDRANIIKTVFLTDDNPGASAWGKIAAERAGTNGEANRAYKTDCGGDPS